MRLKVIAVSLLAIILFAVPANALLNRSTDVYVSLNFSNNMAACKCEISADSSTDWISATVELWRGTTKLNSWSSSGAESVSVDETQRVSSSGTWAQGGISLSLGNSGWASIFTAEYSGLPVTSKSTGRSAMIADVTSNLVYLIVTNTTDNTVTMLRSGIQSFLGISDGSSNHPRCKGILLDGGGSSQLKAKDMFNSSVSLTGDGRYLTQIIKLN